VLAPAGEAGAQGVDEGPVVVSPRPPLEAWILERLDAALVLEWRLDVDEVTPDDEPKQRDSEDRLREILEISSRSYVGHPNLLQLDLSGRFWLEQSWLDLDTEDRTERINTTTLDWNATGLFFQKQTVPITLYGFQNTADIDRQFGGTLEQTLLEYGARIRILSEKAPTTVHLFRREVEQDDRFGGLDFMIDQYTAQADGHVQLGPGQRLTWDASFDDVDEAGQLQTPRSFDRLEGNATHTVDFGDQDQHQFRSRARYFDESGEREFRQVRVDERLRLRHAPKFVSWYDYTFERLDRPDLEQVRHEGIASFRHELFESLTTVGRVGANALDIDTEDFDQDEVFGDLSTDYVKRVPGGRFFAGGDLRLSHLDQSDRGTPLPVFDDTCTFDAANICVIPRRNVTEGSIFVTDFTGLITYVEGVDYSLLVLPDRVEVMRLPGGAIGPMETVLVDYEIGPEPGGTVDTTGYGGDLRYTFDETFLKGLSVFGRYFEQDESRSEELVAGGQIENDFTDLSYGLEYGAWKVYLKAEQQHRDSSLSPFDATRLEARYTENLGPGSVVVLSALYQDLDRTDEDLRTQTLTFSGQWNQQITRRLRMSLVLQWQDVDDSGGFDSQAFEQELDLTWRYRQTELYAQVRNSYRDTEVDETLFQTFIVGVRREF
jgi:hypothetical protein